MATISSYTLNLGDGDVSAQGWRKEYKNQNTVSGNLIRVTFKAGAINPWATDHCSIGIKGGATPPNMTTNPPVELTFSGGHGFTLATNGTALSDWVFLDYATTDTFVIDWDTSAASQNCAVGANVDSLSNFFKASAADWNQATVSGYTTGNQSQFGVSLIEGITLPLTSTIINI